MDKISLELQGQNLYIPAHGEEWGGPYSQETEWPGGRSAGHDRVICNQPHHLSAHPSQSVAQQNLQGREGQMKMPSPLLFSILFQPYLFCFLSANLPFSFNSQSHFILSSHYWHYTSLAFNAWNFQWACVAPHRKVPSP